MIKNLTKRLGYRSSLALAALVAILTSGTGCNEAVGPAETIGAPDGYVIYE